MSTDADGGRNAGKKDYGVCIFCKQRVGLRKRSSLMLKHSIWISGYFETCPGSGAHANKVNDKGGE